MRYRLRRRRAVELIEADALVDATRSFMRGIAQCWMTGQASGTAAGLAACTGLAPRALDVNDLRKELRGQGAFLLVRSLAGRGVSVRRPSA